MKEKILAALKTKFVGVPDAILDRIAAQRAKTVTTEDQITPLVEGLTLQSVFDSYGDSRATEASQTAVSNYEKKHGLKDGKPGANPEPTPTPPVISQPGGLTLEDVTKAVAAAVQPFANEIATFKQQTVAEKRNAEIQAKAKEYGIPGDFISDLKIADDANLDETMKGYQQKFANIGFDGVKSPESGNGSHKTELESFAATIAQGTKEIVESKK